MHKKDFFPLYCVHISHFHSVTLNPKSFSPAATLDPRPRLWTRDRDIEPATATLDPRPRLWTRDRDFGPATRDPRLLVKLEFPVSHESKKMAVVCFTQGTCVMEQSDNNMWFNTETTRLSPTPGFCLLISSLWVGLICYCWWHAFSLFIPV